MPGINKKILLTILALLGIHYGLKSQSFSFNGMSAISGTVGYSDSWAGQIGARYIPRIKFDTPINSTLNFEGEFSANFTGSYTNPAEEDNFYGKIKPYRMWAKISAKQFEIRAGLQKINFGSANMIRPLMWFDQIDPRDPLQLTDGVYGLLGRYYTLDNLNIWVWGLYGNNRKGWEIFETKKGSIEFGGRIQFPISRAEIGLTYHHRTSHIEFTFPLIGEQILDTPENKVGIDIKADLGVGVWLEEVISIADNPWNYKYNNMLTIGADYTFGIGNGLNIMAENLVLSSFHGIFENTTANLTGVSISYPISITTNLSSIIYYDWNQNDVYRFINLGLTYDRFNYYIMGFWNPMNFAIFDFNTGPNLFNGSGIQLMIVYNH